MPENDFTDRDKHFFYRGMMLGAGIGLLVGLGISIFLHRSVVRNLVKK
jgi:hypothetical protein